MNLIGTRDKFWVFFLQKMSHFCQNSLGEALGTPISWKLWMIKSRQKCQTAGCVPNRGNRGVLFDVWTAGWRIPRDVYNSILVVVSSRFLLLYSPHKFLYIFFIIIIVLFGNVVNCYFIGHFTKTLKGKFTFSKSPPQAPLGYENLRERLINPP